jgi:hypothetical protein
MVSTLAVDSRERRLDEANPLTVDPEVKARAAAANPTAAAAFL